MAEITNAEVVPPTEKLGDAGAAATAAAAAQATADAAAKETADAAAAKATADAAAAKTAAEAAAAKTAEDKLQADLKSTDAAVKAAAEKIVADRKTAEDAAEAKLQADLKSPDAAVKAAAEKIVKDREAAAKAKGAVAPEKYADFTLPEGLTVDATMLEKALPLFRDAGLSQEKAQAFVSMYANAVQAATDSQIAAWEKTTADWAATTKADTEVGGIHFDEATAVGRKAVAAFGTPAFQKLVDDYKFGQHPEFVRFAYKVGKAISEDGFHFGKGGGAEQPKSLAERMFPTTPNK